MKSFVLIALCIVQSGCGTIQRAMTLRSIPPEQRLELAKENAKLDAQAKERDMQAKESRPYHYAAIACFLVGLGIVAVQKTLSRVGFVVISGAAGLSLWARISPPFSTWAMWIMVGIAAIGILYWARCYLPSRRSVKQPTS